MRNICTGWSPKWTKEFFTGDGSLVLGSVMIVKTAHDVDTFSCFDIIQNKMLFVTIKYISLYISIGLVKI